MMTPALVVGPGDGAALGLIDAPDDGIGEGLAATCVALAVGDGVGDGVAVADGVDEPSGVGNGVVAPVHAVSAIHAAARKTPEEYKPYFIGASVARRPVAMEAESYS